MHFDQITGLWTRYRAAEIDKRIHPDDHMMNTAQQGWADYNFVGVSTIQLLLSLLAQADTQKVRRILDFGCGHGRAARHIRACFPAAEMDFCDIDPGAAQFCAETFSGAAIVSSDDFSDLSLDKEYDIIWLGSVFTHLSLDRMVALFDKLQSHLAVGGGCLLRRSGVETCTFATSRRRTPISAPSGAISACSTRRLEWASPLTSPAGTGACRSPGPRP